MTTAHPANDPPPPASIARRIFRFLLPVLVLAGGAVLALGLIKTAPKAERKPPPRLGRLVEAQPVTFGPQATIVPAQGTVRPAREVVVYPRVSGEIIALSPELVPGGHFPKGAMLVHIDPQDFELAIRQRQAELDRARAGLALELGQQSVAHREYELLGETMSETNRDLVLRKPQLAQAQSAVEAAAATLDLARLNLERTQVAAPFNCTVRVRNVNVGMQATTATPLATVTGSDEYWVELTVPMEQLQWIRIPNGTRESGSAVRVYAHHPATGRPARQGNVLRLLPDLEPQGRLARLLVTVPDPLGLRPENAGKAPLILGDYVRAEIEGTGLPNAAALERRLLRDGDQVWLLTPGNPKVLEIRPVTVGFRGPETLLVTGGLTQGELIITTDLPAAVPGMSLRSTEDPPPAGARPGPGPGQGGPGSGGGRP